MLQDFESAGYYSLPAIHGDTVVFVCEDDLWTVATTGGVARRLTSNLGMVGKPALSPDGQWVAFTGREEGTSEVYLMPAGGGPTQRLTYLGGATRVVGWTPEKPDQPSAIVFSGNSGQPLERQLVLYSIPSTGGEPQRLPTGPAVSIAFGPQGGQVIGRNTVDLARWKRYRGGTAGDLWIDAAASGQWRRLISLPGNLALPLWLGERVFFISDHEGVGNLYSCLPTGADLRRHTHHADYYVRHAASDGQRIVYQAGGDLYLYDPASASASQRIAIAWRSPRVQRNRKFVDAARYLQHYALHPTGYAVALTSRGQLFTMANWEGAVLQHGEATTPVENTPAAVRRHGVVWLHDGKRLATISDAPGEETVEVQYADASQPPQRLDGLDIGRPVLLAASPTTDQVALTNHRNELTLVDLSLASAKVLDRSPYQRLRGLAWAPDGRWIAYGYADSTQTSIIRLANVATGTITDVTRPVLRDEEPAFDPEGKYLYFLSARDFDPVYDNLHFDLSFPNGMRPYLVTLRKDLPSPFVPLPRPPEEKSKDKDKPAATHTPGTQEGRDPDGRSAAGQGELSAEASNEAADSPSVEPLVIDLEGIADRIVAFPVSEGLYGQIRGSKGKALFTVWPPVGSLNDRWLPSEAPAAKATLEVYDFADQKHDTLVEGVTSFELSLDAKSLIYRAGNRLRVLKAGEKPEEKNNAQPSRKSGWLDLDRLRVSVLPGAEWAQMYRHAWRLQRDQFWSADMSGVDWQAVYRRYWPLVSRIACRSEFSDLMWEMQGELGTSHAYEFGGDYRPEPNYPQGFLGADLAFDAAAGGYRITHIVRGDPWDEDACSPLSAAGINVAEGDVLLAIAGQRLSRDLSPQQALVHLAGEDVLVTVAGRDGAEARTVTVKTLRRESPARYREWVEANRQRVHAATGGRIGYVHIPDMGARGYAEFHRGFLAEVIREGLIVDVRFNGGGHVSQLLLEKLARRRIGYDVPRWSAPESYPSYAVPGPIVALTNEQAGSDGDIFCHAFKLMQLGPVIGKRTWGGVIGIWPRETLIDGGVTTQPEFSTWFEDVGWGVENYGTDPDIEVEIAPHDHVAGRDPQLDRAIAEALRRLEENPPKAPDFSSRPRLALPALPG
jgi:tricorn protease